MRQLRIHVKPKVKTATIDTGHYASYMIEQNLTV